MSIQDSYKIDPSVFNYNGSTTLKVYAEKTENADGSLATYTIKPIQSQIKLFAWLQKHLQFFNNLVTWWISKSISKDENCYIFQDCKIQPKTSNDVFIDHLVQEIAQEEFFGQPDETELRELIKDEYIAEAAAADWDNFSFGMGNNAYSIHISLASVKQLPEKVLEAFYEQCFLGNEHVPTVEIKAISENEDESIAVDAGGLRRQFLTNLFNGLAEQTANGKASYLAASPHSTGGWLPVISKKCRQEEEETLYVAIGKLMGMCLTSQGSLVIGQIFNPAIFDVISQIHPSLLTYQFQDLDDNTKIALFKALMKQDDNSGILTLPDDELIDYANENDSLPLIFKMAQGIAWHLWEQDEWALQSSNKSAWELNSEIQGLFNKELVKDALKSDPESSWNDFNKIKRYFEKWIDASDEELVKKFVQAATGSTTLGATENINVTITADTELLPVFHTCARQVDIGNFFDYDSFKERLEKSLEFCDLNGFQLV